MAAWSRQQPGRPAVPGPATAGVPLL